MLPKAGSWAGVVKRKGKSNKVEDPTAAALLPNMVPEVKTRSFRPAVRQRPAAILIEAGKADFPSLVKKIRGGANREVIGDHVVGMRQSV